MVDRMSSVEIEDVLSSIRRLVTDDLRPKSVPVDDRLILTPSLRVVSDAPLPVQPAEPDVDVLDVDLDADLTAALAEEMPDESSSAEEASEQVDASAFPMFLHRDRRVDLKDAAPEQTFGEGDVGQAVSQISAGIPADGYEAELGDVMPVPEWPESSWVAPDVIDIVEEAELIAVPEANDAQPHSDDWHSAPAADHYATEAEDTSFEDDDAAEAAALAALQAQEAGALTELDEDMLREIVRDIIREELQGTLGERITRNVRKLVRAEINRAMLTQDID